MRPVAGLLVLVAVLLAGCGGDEDDTSAGDVASGGARAASPYVSLTEAEGVLEEVAGLELVRVGRADGATPDEVDPAPVEYARYEEQSGRQFDLYVLASPEAARRAVASVRAVPTTERAVRAVNLVAGFPDPPAGVDAYRRAADALGRIADACAREDDDRELRRVCVEDDPDIGAPGRGVGERAVAEGGTVRLRGITYTPQISRRLNPNIVPDRRLLTREDPGRDRTWFGVALRVCNTGARAATPTRDLALVDAFGNRVLPRRGATASTFAFRPERLAPGACLPEPGSVSDRVLEGALVVFSPTERLLGNLPVALELRAGVERRRIELDV